MASEHYLDITTGAQRCRVEYCDNLETERREQLGTQSRPTHWGRPLYSTREANSAISRHARSALLRGHGPEHGQIILTEFILAVGPLEREHHALAQFLGGDTHRVRNEQWPFVQLQDNRRVWCWVLREIRAMKGCP